jgi:FkbM family methyltransferase
MFLIGDRKLRNILVQSDHGALIVNRNDIGPDGVGIGAFILDHGNNNTVEANTLMQALVNVDNPIIFDVGANIGTFATWVAKWSAGRNGKVYCFEPQRQVFQMLCGNMAINNIFNVYAHELALGKEEKFIELPELEYDQKGSFGSFSLDTSIPTDKYSFKQGNTQRVKMTTVDKFVEEHQIPYVSYLKIDAEGLDIDVLEGSKNVIEKFKPDLYVEYLNLGSTKTEDSSNEGRETLTKYLHGLGYKTMVVHHDIYASVRDVFVEQ